VQYYVKACENGATFDVSNATFSSERASVTSV